MESQKVESYLITHSKYFPGEKFQVIQALLERKDDSQFLMLHSIELRDPTMMLIVSIFGGHLGIDRFLLGETGMGILKLLTCGGLGIWTLIDWFIIMDKTRQSNYEKLARFTV